MGQAADERVELAERLFGKDPPVLPGYWTCFHADCEGYNVCRYECGTVWQDGRR